MSDSRRQYRAIKRAMKQLYPGEPRGNLARHLETLVFMISGIIASKSCQLPKIASRVPGSVHPDSRTKQLSRWVQNENITFDLYFLPFVRPLLERLAAVRPLVLTRTCGWGRCHGWQCRGARLRHADGERDLCPPSDPDRLAGDCR